jgi:hypothetical protein
LDEYRSVLGKLFPDLAPESLVNLPREKLLELTTGSSSYSLARAHPASPATSNSVEAHVSPLSNEDDNLESLQSMPEELDDGRQPSSGDLVEGVSDDVNALSLSARSPSSYLGVSSIQAVLKVIVWLDPGAGSYFSRTPPTQPGDDGLGYESQHAWNHPPVTPPHPPIPSTEMQMLDAYFLYFQAFAPMIDEQLFRETYISGRRRDDHWLALLNIVLALGSIAASGPDDMTHQTYFLRCKSHLSLSSLGSSHLETIQALGLIGGWYCHYISQPNLAYSLMGAALRMAAGLGLHKEFAEVRKAPNSAKLASIDLKRRVWWSLFCMDTWGGLTLGRPSMGRFGPNITVKPPNCRDKVSMRNQVNRFRLCFVGKCSRDSPIGGKHSLRQDRNASPGIPRRSTPRETPGDVACRYPTPRLVGKPPARPEISRALLRVNRHCPNGYALAISKSAHASLSTYPFELRHATRPVHCFTIGRAHSHPKMSRSRRAVYPKYRCYSPAQPALWLECRLVDLSGFLGATCRPLSQ